LDDNCHVIKKQIECFFLQNLAIEGNNPIVTLPTTPIFPHKGDNSVSSGNNKNNMAIEGNNPIVTLPTTPIFPHKGDNLK